MKKSIRIIQEKVFSGFNGKVFAYGNTKLPKSTLIVNLTSASNCPAKALGLCDVANVCYAYKCEKIYKNYRNKNLAVEEWLACADDVDILSLLNAYIEGSTIPITHMRIDEAGDFRDQTQIVQWNEFAKYLFVRWGIVTYTYTHRSDLDFTVATHIMVNGSCPGVAGARRLYLCVSPEVYSQIQLQRGEYKCIADCNRCTACSSINHIHTIYAKQH